MPKWVKVERWLIIQQTILLKLEVKIIVGKLKSWNKYSPMWDTTGNQGDSCLNSNMFDSKNDPFRNLSKNDIFKLDLSKNKLITDSFK